MQIDLPETECLCLKKGGGGDVECCPENIKIMKSEKPEIAYTGIHKSLSLTLAVQRNHIQVCAGIFLQAVGLHSLISNGHYVVFPKG